MRTGEEPRCPFFGSCEYFAQFNATGPRVGTTEQLFNPRFLTGGDLIILDDPDLVRALVQRRKLDAVALQRGVDRLEGKRRTTVRRLLRIVQHAVVDAPAQPLEGAAAWDYLSNTAARHSEDLIGLLRSLPRAGTLPPPGDDQDGYVTVASVEAVPPQSSLN